MNKIVDKNRLMTADNGAIVLELCLSIGYLYIHIDLIIQIEIYKFNPL